MSLPMPNLYHWSPTECRPKIIRRGLKPTTATAVELFEDRGVGPRRVRPSLGFDTARAVCLGTSPSHAWSLCGAIWGEVGSSWDLWQVTLEDDDNVAILPFTGYRMEEVRVLNCIPKSQVWHVGSRTVARLRWSCA